jgi:uncharacterized protein YkwD
MAINPFMKLSLILLMVVLTASTSIKPAIDSVCLTSEEMKLYKLMMDYRKTKKLAAIPLSAKLTQVAKAHAQDLADNYEFDPDRCNPHSWSEKGKWTPCCYTNDHKQTKCMWDKPKEIAGYEGAGYEIAYFSSAGAKADESLAGWQKSSGHNPLIVNEGMWKKANWNALGIGFYKSYGVVWFGEVSDETTVNECSN